MWRPFASGDLKIITGDLTRVYPGLKKFEAGGLVGIGDVQAAAELVAFFGKVGFLGFNRSMDVVRGNRPIGELYGLNLVCNRWTGCQRSDRRDACKDRSHP